jgi:hypothetical protein
MRTVTNGKASLNSVTVALAAEGLGGVNRLIECMWLLGVDLSQAVADAG